MSHYQPSHRAMAQWGRDKQNSAINSLVRDTNDAIITGTRSAKTKALDKKVWIGAAPTGSTRPNPKKRSATPTNQESGKVKKARGNQQDEGEDDVQDAGPVAKGDVQMTLRAAADAGVAADDDNESSSTKTPASTRRSAARKVIQSEAEESEDENSGKRHTKVTDSASDSSGTEESGNEEPTPPPVKRASKSSKPAPAAKRSKPVQSEKQSESSQKSMKSDKGQIPKTAQQMGLGKIKRQLEREKEVPKFAPTADTDDEASSVRLKTKATSKVNKDRIDNTSSSSDAKKAVHKPSAAKTEVKPVVDDPDASDSEKMEVFENKLGQYPAHTYLKYSAGRPLQLLIQTQPIKEIIRKAMEIGNAELVFVDAFPSDGNRTRMSRDATREAARTLGYSDVVDRIDGDVGYLKRLSKPTDARFSQFRSDLKKTAHQIVVDHYNIRAGPGCAEYVASLLLKKAFIFPLTATGPLRAKPYENTLFPILLGKLFFRKPNDVGNVHSDRFFSSVDMEDEAEMAAAMLSFGAVITQHIIGEFSTGEYIAASFSADICKEFWSNHMSLLRSLFMRKLRKYHILMSDLLMQARHATGPGDYDSDDINYGEMSD